VNQPARRLYAMHKKGYAIPISLKVSEIRYGVGKVAYAGIIVPQAEDEEGIMYTDENGGILFASKKALELVS
jgi:hypothetical protein